MNREIAEKWVAELRSGKHKQTRNILKRDDGSMCCLGVLAHIVLDVPESRRADVLSEQSLRLSGIGDSSGSYYKDGQIICLTILNDEEDYTFEQIADVVEIDYELI